MINYDISSLVNYGITNKMIYEEDKIVVINNLIHLLKIDDFVYLKDANDSINTILDNFIEYAIMNKLINDNIIERDLFDTLIISYIVPLPHQVNMTFWKLYKSKKSKATDYLYDLSIKTNYIRMSRINKNISWVYMTDYANLFITINLSKPEKDPKSIAIEKNKIQNQYPKCMICYENVGFFGNNNYPAKQNLRVVKVKLNNSNWYLQYSPYIYYNEHCIVFSEEHKPMSISKNTFIELIEFIEMFPDYFIGSNSDLPIIGGSILSHNHYQGGRFEFPIFSAKSIGNYHLDKYKNCSINLLDWPLDVIKITCVNDKKEELIELANKIFEIWKDYSHPDIYLYAKTSEQHNSITPIVRYENNKIALYIVFRNNYTDSLHPYGVFHPQIELHHIKKENIGLIEVMGLAILPGRLLKELKEVEKYLLGYEYDNELISKHLDWAKKIVIKNDIKTTLQDEVGNCFLEVLKSCSVFKYGNKREEIERIIEKV